MNTAGEGLCGGGHYTDVFCTQMYGHQPILSPLDGDLVSDYLGLLGVPLDPKFGTKPMTPS